LEELDKIGSYFRSVLLPICRDFAADPPKDRKKLKSEHERIRDMALVQVLLKLDGIVTARDPEARARKKGLIAEVLQTLEDLDKGLDE
jgi:hypothetical protein